MHDGSISSSVRASISNLSGHSGRTVRAHYLIKQRERDVANANSFMSNFSKLPKRGIAKRSNIVRLDIDRVMSRASELSPFVKANEDEDDLQSHIDCLPWGTKHKFFNAKTDKVPWSAIELQFIGDWTIEARRCDPDIHSIAKKCRQSLVKEYPEMVPYFHGEHVKKLSRFAHGLRRFQDIYNDNEGDLAITSSNQINDDIELDEEFVEYDEEVDDSNSESDAELQLIW
jgi:hypothetical protein